MSETWQLNEDSPNKPKKCFEPATLKKIKSIAGHIGLLVTFMVYTFIGGLVFRKLELPAETERLRELQTTLLSKRQALFSSVNNTHITNLIDWELAALQPYEQAVQNAARSGLAVELIPSINASEEEKLKPLFPDRWGILQAVFFASTILTTIGYGNIFPSTFLGRAYCILFALIGIPLTLTVIADYGKLFASGVDSLSQRVQSKLPKGLSSWLPSNQTGRKSLGAFAAVVMLFLYLACGAALFILWEKNWTFFEGFYFCFVTMTTIGFGDVVPTNTEYMLFCTGYILVGLALTSTIIELVRMKYADSWKKLQALSGPLTDSLRRLGEQAGGDMSLLQDDLRRVLKAMSMPYRRKSMYSSAGKPNSKDDELEETLLAILQDIATSKAEKEEKGKEEPQPELEAQARKKSIFKIIIYESSV